MISHLYRLLVLGVLSLMTTGPAIFSQSLSERATVPISGAITDLSGARITGAEVTFASDSNTTTKYTARDGTIEVSCQPGVIS